MKNRTTKKRTQRPGANIPEAQKNGMRAIEDWVYWHTAGVTALSRKTGFPDIGTTTAVRWRNRTFLLTADHVIRDYADSELRFVFRPPGPLKRNDSGPGDLFRANPVEILNRFRNVPEDLAALEVSPKLEKQKQVRFFDLDEGSRVVRPIKTSFCAIGFPFDSFESLSPLAAAFRAFALWGNAKHRVKILAFHVQAQREVAHGVLSAQPRQESRGFQRRWSLVSGALRDPSYYLVPRADFGRTDNIFSPGRKGTRDLQSREGCSVSSKHLKVICRVQLRCAGRQHLR